MAPPLLKNILKFNLRKLIFLNCNFRDQHLAIGLKFVKVSFYITGKKTTRLDRRMVQCYGFIYSGYETTLHHHQFRYVQVG